MTMKMPVLLKGKKPGVAWSLGFTMRGKTILSTQTLNGVTVKIPLTRDEALAAWTQLGMIIEMHRAAFPEIPDTEFPES